jgi:pyridoxal 5'-phosphate synthase pdxS subunit
MFKDDRQPLEKSSFEVKAGLAKMLKGGVIIDVNTPEQAKIAEDAGAIAVVAYEKSPLDFRPENNVARMANPELIKKIQKAVSIPVIAKCRIGHFTEAHILEALFVDFIDESEFLTPADEEHFLDKEEFKIPFICGAKNLGEALRRIGEGAAMIRSKCDISTSLSESIRHLKNIRRDIRRLTMLDSNEFMTEMKNLGAPFHLIEQVAKTGKLPVPLFGAGGIVTPADAALMMHLGADSVFISSGIFKSENPLQLAKAMVAAVNYFNSPEILADVSLGLVEFDLSTHKEEILPHRGW